MKRQNLSFTPVLYAWSRKTWRYIRTIKSFIIVVQFMQKFIDMKTFIKYQKFSIDFEISLLPISDRIENDVLIHERETALIDFF